MRRFIVVTIVLMALCLAFCGCQVIDAFTQGTAAAATPAPAPTSAPTPTQDVPPAVMPTAADPSAEIMPTSEPTDAPHYFEMPEPVAEPDAAESAPVGPAPSGGQQTSPDGPTAEPGTALDPAVSPEPGAALDPAATAEPGFILDPAVAPEPTATPAPTPEPTPEPEFDYDIAPGDLCQVLDNNQLAFEVMYYGKTVKLTGEMGIITRDEYGAAVIMFFEGDYTVVCQFDESQIGALLSLVRGDSAVIAGTVASADWYTVYVQGCTLVK